MRRDPQSDPLYRLITRTCQHPPDSLDRQRGLTQVVQAIIKSGKLWQDSSPDYDDALQQTWLYLCRNLCEATTAKQAYDPDRSSVITWLDRYLKQRLEDLRREGYQKSNTASLDAENTPTPIAPPPVPPILDEVKEWVRIDANGELSRTHVKGHPEVNCQTLILRRLPPRHSWEDLSKEFGVPITTLNSFYRRQCFPRLRKFGEHQGYL